LSCKSFFPEADYKKLKLISAPRPVQKRAPDKMKFTDFLPLTMKSRKAQEKKKILTF
jgi:hypothetical protein